MLRCMRRDQPYRSGIVGLAEIFQARTAPAEMRAGFREDNEKPLFESLLQARHNSASNVQQCGVSGAPVARGSAPHRPSHSAGKRIGHSSVCFAAFGTKHLAGECLESFTLARMAAPAIIVLLARATRQWRVSRPTRRGGRVAEGGGLLNRYTVKSCIGGSNPPLSAIKSLLSEK
jgi:hypothetical protein